MDNVINLTEEEMAKIDLLIQHAKEWAEKHQVAVGVAEIALGAGMIATGVNIGAIEIGKDIVMTLTNQAARQVGLSSGIVGCGLGGLVGAIGIVAMGGGIGIPAALVVGGAGWVLGTSGYTIGQEIFNLLHPIDLTKFIGGASLLTIGLALVLDGIKRILPDTVKEKIKSVGSAFVKGGVAGFIFLVECTTKVIANTLDGLLTVYTEATKRLSDFMRKDKVQTALFTVDVIGGATGGACLGTAVAASSVTVLGSQTIGAVALGLGLVSAPIWPVIAIGAAGAAVGVGTWVAVKKLFASSDDADLLLEDLVPVK